MRVQQGRNLTVAVLAGLAGDAEEGGDGVGVLVGWAAVAPLGEHPGGADLTRILARARIRVIWRCWLDGVP